MACELDHMGNRATNGDPGGMGGLEQACLLAKQLPPPCVGEAGVSWRAHWGGPMLTGPFGLCPQHHGLESLRPSLPTCPHPPINWFERAVR